MKGRLTTAYEVDRHTGELAVVRLARRDLDEVGSTNALQRSL